MPTPDAVRIKWTTWLRSDRDNEPYDGAFFETRVLYMYATTRAPLYIGKADYQSVYERLRDHETDGIADFIRREYPSRVPAGIKVGFIVLGAGQRLSSQLLADIESLLIFHECRAGRCVANIANSRTRNIVRPGLIVRNTAAFQPLKRTYGDDPE